MSDHEADDSYHLKVVMECLSETNITVRKLQEDLQTVLSVNASLRNDMARFNERLTQHIQQHVQPIPSTTNLPNNLQTNIQPPSYEHAVGAAAGASGAAGACAGAAGVARVAGAAETSDSATSLELYKTKVANILDSHYKNILRLKNEQYTKFDGIFIWKVCDFSNNMAKAKSGEQTYT